jgi:hypothetical protein
MADQTSKTGDQTGSGSSHGFEKAATSAKSVADQALSAGRDIKDQAIGLRGGIVRNDRGSGFGIRRCRQGRCVAGNG